MMKWANFHGLIMLPLLTLLFVKRVIRGLELSLAEEQNACLKTDRDLFWWTVSCLRSGDITQVRPLTLGQEKSRAQWRHSFILYGVHQSK